MGMRASRRQSLCRSMNQCAYGLLLLSALWESGCAPLLLTPTPVAPIAEPEDARLIVQVTYPTVERLNALAGELDIWEVDRAAQTFVARVTLAQYETLVQQALPVALDCTKMAQYGEPVSAPIVATLMAEQCPEK
jgi:hypothetical protein